MQNARSLIDDGDVTPEVFKPKAPDVAAIETDDAGIGVQQAHGQVGDGGLAAAAWPDDGQYLAGADAEREVLHRGRTPVEAERHALERQLAARGWQGLGAGLLLHVNRASRTSATRRSDTLAVAKFA